MKLIAVVVKEFLVLIRDVPGLSLLFLMPMFLILAVTLTQEKAKHDLNMTRFELLLVDDEGSDLGRYIGEEIESAGIFSVVRQLEGKPITMEEAGKLLSEGKFQAGVHIPEGATAQVKEMIGSLLNDEPAVNKDQTGAVITVILDPAVNELFIRSVANALKGIMKSVEMRIAMEQYHLILYRDLDTAVRQHFADMEEEMNRQLDRAVAEIREELIRKIDPAGKMSFDIAMPEKRVANSKQFADSIKAPVFPEWKDDVIITREEFARISEARIIPTFIQNNVPAFALFAMFFIVVPLSGGMITEKNEGTYNRMRILQVSYVTYLSGKVVVYTLVCCLQFLFMVLCGMYIFPALVGTEPLVVGGNITEVVLATIAAALAAIGFGLFTGTVFNTYGQAAMFGALMNVILCIMGGVFIPVFMMPSMLDKISRFTPLRWAMDSFITLFVREGGLTDILPDLLRLAVFFLAAMVVSVLTYIRRH